ncbi:MAG: DinB family protein [Chloroflexi bacterium]|nr:DinB family protein [Chloroflexota bacterium]
MQQKSKQALIDQIRDFPNVLEATIANLSAKQLQEHYLPDEWSVQQIVHHLADSHMNSVIRLKLILTMERPPLQAYPQEIWAELADVYQTPIEDSLSILRGLHHRWAAVFESLEEHQWQRMGVHSEDGEVSAHDLLLSYTNHCAIHLDQIKRVLAAAPLEQEQPL